MKKLSLFVASLLMVAAVPSVAQSNYNQDEVVKIDRHNHRAFREGEILVKFKTGSGIVQSGARSVNAFGVNRVLSNLGVTEMEQLMPLTGDEQQPVTRSLSGKHINDVDLSTLYRVRFDATKVPSVQTAIDNMKKLSEVEFAEPNYLVYALSDGTDDGITYDTAEEAATYMAEPLYAEQWGIPAINLPALWQQPKITTKRPVIAILDTGVDITHPDLADNIWTNTLEAEGVEEADDDNNGFADDLHGWDFINQTGRIGDWNGHGTHCAGIAAAVGNNGIGITGANPDALIMPITIMQSDGTGDVATIVKGIDYAVANGADILSMSFGGYYYSESMKQSLTKAYTKAVLIAAAGNDCLPIAAIICENCFLEGDVLFPAGFHFVLGVEASSNGGTRSRFSNYDNDGPILSSYLEEELYNYELRAPGSSILSTYPNGKYKVLNGTSMACPLVAGAVSRLLQCKEYDNWETLFGDLIYTRKQNDYGDINVEMAYNLENDDRVPELDLVTYVLKDTIDGDGDGRPDAGETIALYPTFRNEWGEANNIRFWLEIGEYEDTSIVDIVDDSVAFGKSLSTYAKNISVNPVCFKIDKDCVDGRKIRIVLHANCENVHKELVQECTIIVENGVEIGGMITEDMTLYPNVHYIVTQSVAIPSGVTLTIKPGTKIVFKGGEGISMASGGHFKCHGNSDSLITFEPFDRTVSTRIISSDTLKYVCLTGFGEHTASGGGTLRLGANMENCIVRDSWFDWSNYDRYVYKCHFVDNFTGGLYYSRTTLSSARTLHSNCVNSEGGIGDSCNVFNSSPWYTDEVSASFEYNSGTPVVKTINPIYLGTSSEEKARYFISDMAHPTNPVGFGYVDLSNMLTRPSTEAHGIVWKVVVNGYDTQDEFELLPPLGVGKHKFEIYFNRPMDTSVKPFIAMGVRPPYTTHTITEDGSWSPDSLIYIAYLAITGKTNTDGLNRLYVAEAKDNEHFEIPIEKSRFNVQVAATGSLATGLMAEAGLGKVSLTWDTDEEDFEDLLGYNIYRYTEVPDSTYTNYYENGSWHQKWEYYIRRDTVAINSSIIDSQENSFIDYDVVPNMTYYYFIKQLTTSLSSHPLSNVVAATPLTAQKGDANGSLAVDVADVVTEIAYMTNQDPQPFIFEAADVNSDLAVNILDVVGTLNLILTPSTASIASVNNTATYTVEDGILYVESPVALGGVQVRIAAPMGTEFTALEGLNGFEQTGNWQSDEEYLFLAYSMVGRTIAPGKQALLRIGDAGISQVVLSDARGTNVLAINGNATGIGAVEAMQMTLPYPNPFSTQLTIPYMIGKEGDHQVSIVVSDLAGRAIYRHNEVNGFGEYCHVWVPAGNLANGLYLVSLYVDGTLMHTAKALKN